MRATHSFISIKAPFQGACRQQQTSLLSKDSVHFQADSNKPKEGPLSLTADELGKLSLKEKQQLFAKLPLLKYQGKPLTGSEFLNLVYHYPYPKGSWVFSETDPVFVDAMSAFAVLTLGLVPLITLPLKKITDVSKTTSPFIPRKGLDREVFKKFCKEVSLTTVERNQPIDSQKLITLLTDIKLIHSYENSLFLFDDPECALYWSSVNQPISFTRTAKSLLKKPQIIRPTLSFAQNMTFAELIQ